MHAAADLQAGRPSQAWTYTAEQPNLHILRARICAKLAGLLLGGLCCQDINLSPGACALTGACALCAGYA